MTLRSQPGQGSSFFLEIPITERRQQMLFQRFFKETRILGYQGAKRNIWLVEAAGEFRSDLTAFLQRLGFQVQEIEQPQEVEQPGVEQPEVEQPGVEQLQEAILRSLAKPIASLSSTPLAPAVGRPPHLVILNPHCLPLEPFLKQLALETREPAPAVILLQEGRRSEWPGNSDSVEALQQTPATLFKPIFPVQLAKTLQQLLQLDWVYGSEV